MVVLSGRTQTARVLGMIRHLVFAGVFASIIFFCGHPRGVLLAGRIRQHPRIVFPLVACLVFIFQAYVCILEWLVVRRVFAISILLIGVLSIFLAVACFVLVLREMWRIGLRPIGYDRVCSRNRFLAPKRGG